MFKCLLCVFSILVSTSVLFATEYDSKTNTIYAKSCRFYTPIFMAGSLNKALIHLGYTRIPLSSKRGSNGMNVGDLTADIKVDFVKAQSITDDHYCKYTIKIFEITAWVPNLPDSFKTNGIVEKSADARAFFSITTACEDAAEKIAKELPSCQVQVRAHDAEPTGSVLELMNHIAKAISPLNKNLTEARDDFIRSVDKAAVEIREFMESKPQPILTNTDRIVIKGLINLVKRAAYKHTGEDLSYPVNADAIDDYMNLPKDSERSKPVAEIETRLKAGNLAFLAAKEKYKQSITAYKEKLLKLGKPTDEADAGIYEVLLTGLDTCLANLDKNPRLNGLFEK